MSRRLRTLGGFVVALASGFALTRLFRARRNPALTDQIMGTGAVSAVTGGPPEDMNEMPPNIDDKDTEPVFDGHVLSLA